MSNDHTDWKSISSWILRAAILIHLVGLFVAMHTRVGSSLGGVALMDWGIPHPTIGFWERTGSKILLFLGLSLLIRPLWPVAVFIGGVLFAEAWAAYSFGGNPFYEWSISSQMLRWGPPLALAVMLLPGRIWNTLAAIWMLRLGIAVVFAVHGIQALGKHPGFIDLMIGSTRNLLGMRLTESSAVAIMKVIGIVDIVVAALLLVGRSRWLLAWLAFWGLLTAASRVTSYGMMSYPEILTRSSHFLAPVVVYTLGRWGDREFPGGAWRWLKEGYLAKSSARQGAASLAPSATGTQTIP